MRTMKSSATLTLCILSTFGLSVVLNHQEAKAEKICSNRSLYGAYEFQGGGYVNNTDPFAFNAINNYDGNGNMKGTILAIVVAGNVKTNLPTQGKYQVNSDCIVTISVTRNDGSTANYIGFLYDNSRKLNYTGTDSGAIVNLKGERIKDY